MKHFFLSLAWMLLASGVVLTSIATVHFYLQLQEPQVAQIDHSEQVRISVDNTAPEGEVAGIYTEIELKDARAQIVSNFLERYNSPLEPHDYFGKKLVEIADRNEIDFRLLPSIAMQESNLCKVTPPNSFNCLGLGVHSKGTWEFDSYESNFEAAAKILKKNYIDIGLVTPEQIMKKYTPGSNGSWAASVNQWMAEMRYDDRESGRTLKTDADLTEFTQPASPSTTIELE